MRILGIAVVVSVSLPALGIAQQPMPPTQDYWIRAAVSDRAISGANGVSGGLLVSGNMAFGGMTNEVRHVVLIGVETGDHQQETAVLVGARREETNRSLSAAAGLGILSHTSTKRVFLPGLIPSSNARSHDGPYPGIALELHGTGFVKSWLGVGGGIIANVNRHSSFCAMIFSMDLGDLHDPRKRS